MNTDSGLNFSKYITVSLIVSAASQLSTYVYYSEFNFVPTAYFELTDFLVSAAKDFMFIAIIMFFLLQTLGLQLIPMKGQLIANETKIKSKFWDYLNKNYFMVGIFITNFIILITAVMQGLSWSFIVVTILIYVIPELLKYNIKKYHTIEQSDPELFKIVKAKTPYVKFEYIMIAFSYMCISYVFIHIKSENAKHNNRYTGSELILPNEKVLATSKVLFIGKNKNYWFIYNSPDSSIRIIKREELFKEVIRSKKISIFDALIFSY